MHESSRSQISHAVHRDVEKAGGSEKEELDAKMSALRTSGSLVDASAEATSKLTQISTFSGGENNMAPKSMLTTTTLGLAEVNNKIAEMDRTNAKTTTGSSTNTNQGDHDPEESDECGKERI